MIMYLSVSSIILYVPVIFSHHDFIHTHTHTPTHIYKHRLPQLPKIDIGTVDGFQVSIWHLGAATYINFIAVIMSVCV